MYQPPAGQGPLNLTHRGSRKRGYIKDEVGCREDGQGPGVGRTLATPAEMKKIDSNMHPILVSLFLDCMREITGDTFGVVSISRNGH